MSKGTIFDICQKNADISKVKGVLVLKGIVSETTYMCVFTCQVSSFYQIPNKF